MRTFLIQTIDNKVKHDFSFQLLEAIDYQNWYCNEKRYDVILSENCDIENCIPVGAVEFVLLYLKKHYGIEGVKPINIPPELMNLTFLKRHVEIVDTEKSPVLIKDKPLFIKDNNKIKGFADIITDGSRLKGEYLVSEVINIDSEWRAFVYRSRLVGLQNYSGDFTLFPDVTLINDMIQTYSQCPPAYTLDVGINKEKGTFLIEVHNFFSCGLYGFHDHRILPQMFIQSFQSLIPTN